jgi:hypothetical protein
MVALRIVWRMSGEVQYPKEFDTEVGKYDPPCNVLRMKQRTCHNLILDASSCSAREPRKVFAEIEEG